MGYRRAADEDIEIIYRLVASPQSGFLVCKYFQSGRNGQPLLGKQLSKLRHLLMLARLPNRTVLAAPNSSSAMVIPEYETWRQTKCGKLLVETVFSP